MREREKEIGTEREWMKRKCREAFPQDGLSGATHASTLVNVFSDSSYRRPRNGIRSLCENSLIMEGFQMADDLICNSFKFCVLQSCLELRSGGFRGGTAGSCPPLLKPFSINAPLFVHVPPLLKKKKRCLILPGYTLVGTPPPPPPT